MPWGIAAGAVVGAVGSSIAANKASKAQQSAADTASNTELQMYNQTREDQLPWLNTGTTALNRLAYLTGLNPTSSSPTGTSPGGTQFDDLVYDSATGKWSSDKLHSQAAEGGDFGPNDEARYQALLQQQVGGIPNAVQAYQQQSTATQNAANSDPAYGSLTRPFSMADYQADPGYQFRIDQGNQALERSAAARGGLNSGRALKDLTAYSQGAASQEYGAAYDRFNNDQSTLYNRLAGIAGTGQSASNSLGSLGANTANAVAGNQIGAGNAQAAGYVGTGNAINNGISQGISGYQTNRLFGMLGNSGGGNSIYSSQINGR